MKRSSKRLLTGIVAMATVLANTGAIASFAEELTIGDGGYVEESAAQNKIRLSPLRTTNEEEYLFFKGLEYKDGEGKVHTAAAEPSTEDSIYREGYQTLFTDEALSAEELAYAIPLFDINADGATLTNADGAVQESGVSEVDLSNGAAEYTLSADGSADYEGEKNYSLNVVAKSDEPQLYVIQPDERNITFDDYYGKEYNIALYNLGIGELDEVSVELVDAENVAISDIGYGSYNWQGRPYTGTPSMLTLVPNGIGDIKGTLNFYVDGRPVYSMNLKGISNDQYFVDSESYDPFAIQLDEAVKYVPYSFFLDFADGRGSWFPSDAAITVSGLDNGFTYDAEKHEISGTPKKCGTEYFKVTVDVPEGGDGDHWAYAGTSQTYTYCIEVLPNSAENVAACVDFGYEILKPIGVPDGNYGYVRTYHGYLPFGYRSSKNSKGSYSGSGLNPWDYSTDDFYDYYPFDGAFSIGGRTEKDTSDIPTEKDTSDIPDDDAHIDWEGHGAAASMITQSQNGDLDDETTTDEILSYEGGGYDIVVDDPQSNVSVVSGVPGVGVDYADEILSYEGGGGDVATSKNTVHFLDYAFDVTPELFISRGDYNEFVTVWYNGQRLGKGQYESQAGSTEVVIKEQTMRELTVEGTNTIALEFRTNNGAHEQELRVCAESFEATLESVGFGAGGGSSSLTDDSAQSADAELDRRESTVPVNPTPEPSPNPNPNPNPTPDPEPEPKPDPDNPDGGIGANYALAATLMIGSLGALAYSKRKFGRDKD